MIMRSTGTEATNGIGKRQMLQEHAKVALNAVPEDYFDIDDFFSSHVLVRSGVASSVPLGPQKGDYVPGISSGIGSATVLGTSGDDTLHGSGDQDTVRGFEGDDILYGEDGGDYLHGDAGADTLNGGAGIDVADYSWGAAIHLDLVSPENGSGDAAGDVLVDTEYIYGSLFNDTMNGDGGGHYFRTLDGDDIVNAGAGIDRLDGGAGADTLDGGDDMDIAEYAYSDAGVNIDLNLTTAQSGGWAQGDILSNIENVAGSKFDDTIIGTGGANMLHSYDGADSVNGADGNDYVFGGAGADTMGGGEGIDVANYSWAGEAIHLDLVTPGNSSGYAAGDSLSGFEYFYGTAYNDTMIGDDYGQYLRTLNGHDSIAAGAGDDRLDGGDGADVLDGGTGADISEYYYSTAAVNVDLSLTTEQAGGWALGDVLSNIENVGGSIYADTITGSGAANKLIGYDGSDRLSGGGGNDTLSGGVGDDTYYVDSSSDEILEAAGQGTDIVISSDHRSLLLNFVEHLILTGAANINGTGNDLNNSLTGNDGINSLEGGLGDDTYYVQNTGDIVKEYTNQGTDLIVSTVTYTLAGRQVENLTLSGTAAVNATGNSLANTLIGNSGNNTLDASSGHDRLDGGEGADSLIGGTGDDTYVADASGDTITEVSGAGLDLVESSITLSLAANVENLTLTGSAAINGTGNDLNNVLTGNSGTNVLAGGLGNDTYYIQNTSDNVVETGGAGTDLIISTVSYSLNGRYAETLNLSGTANANATGNSLANSLGGNAGNNTLNGKGGKDVLSGGLGADVFLFETGSGLDTVTDFNPLQNDSINVNAYTGGTANTGMVTQSALNVLIALSSGNVVTVNNATVADVLAHMVW